MTSLTKQWIRLWTSRILFHYRSWCLHWYFYSPKLLGQSFPIKTCTLFHSSIWFVFQRPIQNAKLLFPPDFVSWEEKRLLLFCSSETKVKWGGGGEGSKEQSVDTFSKIIDQAPHLNCRLFPASNAILPTDCASVPFAILTMYATFMLLVLAVEVEPSRILFYPMHSSRSHIASMLPFAQRWVLLNLLHLSQAVIWICRNMKWASWINLSMLRCNEVISVVKHKLMNDDLQN